MDDGQLKADAAANALTCIFPGVATSGNVLSVLMLGHAAALWLVVDTSAHASGQDERKPQSDKNVAKNTTPRCVNINSGRNQNSCQAHELETRASS